MVWNDQLAIAIADLKLKPDAELDAIINIHLDGHEVVIYFMACLMEFRRRSAQYGDDRFKELMQAPPSPYLVKH